MAAFRILGGILALVLLIGAVVRYRRRQISRLNLIISSLIAVAVMGLAIFPDLLDPVLSLFNFQKDDSRSRLVGLLILAVFVLFVLLFRLTSYVDQNQRSIRQLVEALAVASFDFAKVPPKGARPRIVVVSPAFNEAENVGAVAESMPAVLLGHEVMMLVIDDGSTDGTAAAAEASGAYAASNPIRRGGGLALRVGYEIALKLGADIVVSIDADGQHLPEEMGVLIEPIIADQADMTNGSRLLGEFEKESTIRHLGVHFFSGLVTIMTGQRVTDISSGYRATKAATLRKLVLEQDQFWTSELLIEGLRQHARIEEVPITIRARAGGKSKKPKSFRYAWNFTKAIIQTWLR
jgi:hypothetical protein